MGAYRFCAGQLSNPFGHSRDRSMSRHGLIVACVLGIAFSASRRSPAAEPVEVETTYYLGESRMSIPDGKLVRTSLSLVKRVVSRKDNRIEEHVLSVDERDSKVFVVTLEVKGSSFIVSERSG